MSWQAASFLILAAVLLGGFAWYERSRPSSQVVALVAALAALAIAGRVAFAALPNVKPTTDVVVFAGYALGPAPGFAVGALAGLVSNFWFGQGPWTPWQMAAWGLCGILGAALVRRRGEPGRLTLALVCALAGIGFGALMNFYEMSYGGEYSLQRFLALESRAVPFDAAHAIGNATLALLAGPAMVRMLVRFRRRFEWRPAAATTALLLALALPTLLPARAQAADTGRAVDWLLAAQNADGGWGEAPGSASDAAITCWAMLGLEAAGRNPLDVSRAAHTPLDFLRARVGALSSSGDFARTVLALEGAGVDPRSFGGRNLVAALLKRRRDDGSFEGWPVSTAFAVIALRRAGATGGLAGSISWLASVQNPDGGWGDVPGSPSSTDGTGAVMEAIPRTGAAQRGLEYLRAAQSASGGFGPGGGGAINSQSTAWAVQGMIAVGADPAAAGPGSTGALDYLSARQAADGHFRYSASSDQTPVWVTGQALAAAAGRAFPVPAPPRSATSTPAAPATSGSASGGGHSPATTGSNGTTPATPPSLGNLPSAPSSTGSGPPTSVKGLAKALREHAGVLPGAGPRAAKPPASGAPGPGGVPLPPGLPGLTAPQSGSSAPPPGSAAPAAAPFVASGPGSGPKPWTPLGIGLASGGLALAGVVLLGRRFGW